MIMIAVPAAILTQHDNAEARVYSTSLVQEWPDWLIAFSLLIGMFGDIVQ
jgi:hypothetical protein